MALIESPSRDAVPTAEVDGRPVRQGSNPAAYRALVWALRIGILAAFLGVWQKIGTSTVYWQVEITSPSKIWSKLAAWVTTHQFWIDFRTTLTEAALGYLLGVGGALVMVAIVIAVPNLGRFLKPFLAMLNALPKVVLAPLFIVWFGVNTKSKVYFVASLIFFIIFYGVYTAIRAIDRTLLDNTRALGASRLQLVRSVFIPAIVTWLIASLRVGGAYALLAAIFAEFLGASGGIGSRISQGQQLLHNDQVMAGIFVIAIAALVLDRVLVRLERRFAKWRLF